MSEQMDLTERTLRREDKFTGRILTVHVDTVELPNGGTALREVADHPGGVAVLALDGENNVLTVTQYRYPFGKALLEIPAGKLDHPGEDPYAAGLRELKEETGAVPGTCESLGFTAPWAAFCPPRAATGRRCTSTWPGSSGCRSSTWTRTNF